MKRIFSFALSLVLLLSGIAMLSVSAETKYAEATVAVIGTTEYSSLAAAAEAAQNGDVIEIVKDETTSNTAKITLGVTIKGNNHTLTYNLSATDTTKYALEVVPTAVVNVRIENFSIVANKSNGVHLSGPAHFVLDSFNVKAQTVTVRAREITAGGTLVVNGGVYEKTQVSSTGDCFTVGGDATFNDVTIRSMNGANTLYAIGDYTTVTVNSGTYSRQNGLNDVTKGATGCVLGATNSARMIINGGTFVSKSISTNDSINGLFYIGSSKGKIGYFDIYGGSFYDFTETTYAKTFLTLYTSNANVMVNMYGGTFYRLNVEGKTDPYFYGGDQCGIRNTDFTATVEENVVASATANNTKFSGTCTKYTFTSLNSLSTQKKANDSSTDIRFVAKVNSLDAYQSVGYVISLTNSKPTIDGEKVIVKETSVVYSSLIADGNTVNAPDGEYYVALSLTGVPEAYYDTQIYIRTFTKDAKGTVVYGDVKTVTVSGLN